MKFAAFIFCLLSCVFIGWAIITLAWCIPMTVSVYKAYKGEKELSTGFKVCVLIFCNFIAGILLLCDTDNK